MTLDWTHARTETVSPAGRARFLAVYLPAFRLERCGWDSSEPVVLIGEHQSALRVITATSAARGAGLRPGMTLAEARAVLPDVGIEWHEPAIEAEDRLALIEAVAARLSDRVAAAGPDVLVLEAGGVAHLTGGEEGLLDAACAVFSSLGHEVRLAIADHPGAAVAIAQWGEEGRRCVPTGRRATAAALASLPFRSLEPSEDLARSAAALGVSTIGDWARLDRAGVGGRYGAEGVALHRLAQGEPSDARPWVPAELDPPVEARMPLGGPTSAIAPVLSALPGLLREVLATLAVRCRSAVRVTLRLNVEDGPARRLTVHAGRPTRDLEVLRRLLTARLEGVRLPSPAIELVLEVDEHAPEVAWIPSWFDRSTGGEDLPGLLARLCDTLGSEAVYEVEGVDSWRPEAAWRSVPLGGGGPRAARGKARRDPVDPLVAAERAGPRPRPAVVLTTPRALSVTTEGGVPVAIGSQACGRPVGPERLQGGWWDDEQGFDRDYWVVEVDGGAWWMFREAGGWWLHGYF